MLKFHLKIAWRHLKRHKAVSILNISGMAVGIAAVFLIAIYVQNELSYDRFHKNAERIFRLSVRQKFDNGERIWHQSAWFMGPRLLEEYPYILLAFSSLKAVPAFWQESIRNA